MTTYYFGTINKIINRLTYEVLIDIDGIVDKKPAFPFSRGEMDEPKVGDKVVLHNIDPLYGSMYLYTKLKEDEFVGFRSNGKAVEITPDYIEMSVFKFKDSTPGENESQDAHDEFGNWYTRVKLYKESGNIVISVGKGEEGSLTINTYKDVTITTMNDVEVNTHNDVTVNTSNDITINTGDNVTVNTKNKTHINSGEEVVISAPKMQIKNAASVPNVSGALNCIPSCPLIGVVHYKDFGLQLSPDNRPGIDKVPDIVEPN